MIRSPRACLLASAAAIAALFLLPLVAHAQDRAPVVLAPTGVYGNAGVPVSFVLLASDPDGDAIASLTGSPLPSGATFTSDATHTSGTFQWTPSAAGQTNVTFTASNSLSGSATVFLQIYAAGNSVPVVNAPPTASTDEQALLTFTVSASDPDGEAITAWNTSALPANAIFTVDAAKQFGTFSWLPTFSQAGLYRVTFVAMNLQIGSGTTYITVRDVPHAPVVSAPASVSTCAGSALSFDVIASDPDGDPITSLTAAPIPSGATFVTNAALTSGTFAWTPASGQEGSYNVTFTAANALSGSASTAIDVGACSATPVVAAPATVSGPEGTPITFVVTASTPDGEPIVQLAASPLPAGAAFTTDATNTSGTFAWTPGYDQAGTYAVTFTATATLTGSATTTFSISNVDRAPVVTAPGFLTVCPLSNLTFTVSASDPDGDAISSLTVYPVPSTNFSFTVNATNTSGTFSWTPSFSSEGSWNFTFTAANSMTGARTTNVYVACFDRAPVVTAPLSVSGAVGTLIEFTVTAIDPDGDAIVSFGTYGAPVGSTFSTNASHTSGTFDWTPTPGQTGVFNVVFTATNALSGSATTQINVSPSGTNLPPVAEAGGPYSGLVHAQIAFDGTGSSDPNGDQLAYSWAFGDGATGVGPTPQHTYAVAGSYTATLTVSDGFLTGSDTAPVTIQNQVQARVFVAKNRFRRIRIASAQSGRTWCAQVEPIAGDFLLENVDLSTVQLGYNGAFVNALASKGAVISDTDGNGVPDLEVCFAVSDFASLGFPAGTNTVTVTVRGNLMTGGSFTGDLSIEVVNGSGQLAASIAPNPLNPEAVLSFQTSKAGRVRVQVFDLAGRLVRTAYDAETAAGRHEVRIDGRSETGSPLASGVYFYRIDASEASSQGRFTILK